MKGIDKIRLAIAQATPGPCWLWEGAKTAGYAALKHDGQNWLGHRLVCVLVYGEPESPELQAAHRCGQRACINRHHLRWATQSVNEEDKILHGLSNRGQGNGHAKLDENQVREIRSRYARGETQVALGAAYDVNRATVGEIVRGEIWGWLEQAA